MWIKFGQELYNSNQFTRILCVDYSNGQFVIELHLDRYYQPRIVLKFDTKRKRDIAFNNIVLAIAGDYKAIIDLNSIIGVLGGD